MKFTATPDGDNYPSVSNYLVNYHYSGEAIYHSQIFDGLEAVNWNYIFFDAEMPLGANLSFQTRTGNSNIFDETWSDWVDSADGVIMSPAARYLQVKIVFTSGETSSPLLRSFGVMFAPLGKISASPITNISSSSPEVLLLQGESLPDANIYIPAETTSPSLNVSHFKQIAENSASALISQNINIFSEIFGRQIRLRIPEGISITAPSSDWSGVISLPQSRSVVDLELGEGLEAVSSFKVGDENMSLSFDKAVRILIPGLASRSIGYYDQDGEFHEINDICAADTQEAGDALPEAGDCKIDVSGDLVIYTKHFTQFVVFQIAGFDYEDDENNNDTPSVISEPRTIASTPPVPACTAVTYSDWQPCQAGFNIQFRTIASQSPESCSLTAEQRQLMERSCSSEQTSEQDGENGTSSEDSSALKDSVLSRERTLTTKINTTLSSRLSGRILLQVEEKGEAWYLNPLNNLRYYLGRPADAFNLMRALGLGATTQDISSFLKNTAPKRLSGRILLQVEDKGQAYYVNPLTLKLHYLGRPDDAFNLMRTLGLGISNSNVRQIGLGE